MKISRTKKKKSIHIKMTQYIQSTINEKIPARYIIHYYKPMIKNEKSKNRVRINIIRNQ